MSVAAVSETFGRVDGPPQTEMSRVHKVGMGYAWSIPDSAIELHADYLVSTREELHAEVRATWRGKHLHMARFNLSTSGSRKTLATVLASQTLGIGLDWATMIEQFCVTILLLERQGEPVRYAGPAERRPIRYLIDHLVVANKSNLLFAPGGSGKGMLSVGLCCASAAKIGLGGLDVRESRPFYFDWEDDFATFEDRLNLVAGGMGIAAPRVPYRRMRGLVKDHINDMARVLDDAGATFAVIDSFSAAGGTVTEHTGWDSIAHRMFDALDQVPDMTWLIIDHVAGDTVRNPSGKAFGSIQKMNRARNAWEMRSDQEPGSSTVHMKLFHAKWNHTGRHKPLGIRMVFGPEGVQFVAEDPIRPDGVAVTMADKMALVLDAGPLSTLLLARACDAPESTIRGELKRFPERFNRRENGLIDLVRATPEDLPW
jgi:hypothetical protein